MDTIDTAPIYGFGRSEEVVGRAIAGRRDKVRILTKYGMRWGDGPGTYYFSGHDPLGQPIDVYRYAGKDAIIAECEASLRRLGTDYIDLYQQHWPDPGTAIEESMEALAILLQQGKIRAAGVSNFAPDLIERAREIVPIVSVQSPYSMVNLAIEDDVLPYAREHGLGVLAYSPLQRGLLTGKISLDYHFPSTDHRGTNPYFSRENRIAINEMLASIKPYADDLGATLDQLRACRQP